MATKDWKKLRNEDMWWNDRKNIGMGYSNKSVYRTKGYWGSSSTKEVETFSNRKLAIKFIREYMKTH